MGIDIMYSIAHSNPPPLDLKLSSKFNPIMYAYRIAAMVAAEMPIIVPKTPTIVVNRLYFFCRCFALLADFDNSLIIFIMHNHG
jgi:hypothetical protein